MVFTQEDRISGVFSLCENARDVEMSCLAQPAYSDTLRAVYFCWAIKNNITYWVKQSRAEVFL
ncbi:hypothetical protein N9C17_00350, partial [bacterium]|nr:hypothetical protein [bacterium]